MKKITHGQPFPALLLAAALILSALAATAAEFAIDPTNPNNGLTDIYSATFDPPLNPSCTGAPDPAACAFFGGQPPATRAIVVTPTPTGVEAVADTTLCVQDFSGTKVVPPCPAGTLYSAPTPSTLNLTLSANNTQLAINDGNIFLPNLTLTINGGTSNQTDVVAEGASIINFAPSAGSVPIDASGVAIFEIDLAPSIAADFATFTDIVTNCTGPLCALIPILTLDMIRYRLIVDWDPTFSFYTADFTGQTANNSMVFATLNSGLPAISVTGSVGLGTVIKNSTGQQTVTVTNTGLTNLVLGQIAQTDPLAPPFSIVLDNCSAQTVAPGGNCTFDVQFAPTATGVFTDSLDIPTNIPDPMMPSQTVSTTVNVSGTGVAPVIVVTSPVAFGSVTVMSSADQVVTVTNGGDTDLVLGTVTPPNAPFSLPVDLCSGQTLGIAASCMLTARFSPATVGAFSDSFAIPSNDPDTPVKTIGVSGTGSAIPVAKISVTDVVNFGSVLEMTTAVQTVTVTSSGTASLVIGQISQPGALFSVFNDMCSNQTLAPAANCTLSVQFAPTGVGTVQDSFDIPSNDQNIPTATVNLVGTGAPTPVPVIAVTDSVPPPDDLLVPFGNVIEMMSADETITVTNNGTADLTMGQIVQPGAPFSVLNDTCSNQVLIPAAACTVGVRFAPAVTGAANGSVDIPSNDPNTALVTVDLTGTGVPGPAPDITVTDPVPPPDDLMMPFGNVTESTAWDRTVTITNDGNDNLVMGMIAGTDTLADPFSILNDTCSAQIIAPAASCTVDVRFLPAAVGNFSDSFDIPSNDPDEPVLTFSVDGDGVVLGTGTIGLKPSGGNSGLFGSALRPVTVFALLMLIAWNLRRRYRRRLSGNE